MELLQTFKYKNVEVKTYYIGTDKLFNTFALDSKIIHEDRSFRPSPLYGIDNIQTMVSLLDFYTLTSDAVEDGYFKARNNPELLEWAENSDEAQEIRIMLYDWEMRDDEERLNENEMTYEQCIEIESYIIND